jgi:hypothetical protein
MKSQALNAKAWNIFSLMVPEAARRSEASGYLFGTVQGDHDAPFLQMAL